MRVLMVHCRYQIRGGEDECYEAEQSLLRAGGVEVETYEDENRRVEQLGSLSTAVAHRVVAERLSGDPGAAAPEAT